MIEQFNSQQEFTEEVKKSLGSKFPLSEKEKVKWTKDYILYIISECNDLLEQLDWKGYWSNDKKLIQDNIGIEIIDIQKFVWGLCKIWDISYEQFADLYDRKTAEVESKWNQEQMLKDLNNYDKVCIIDIDGVLAPYPQYFINWAKENHNTSINKKNIIEWEHYKHLYRESGAKRNIPFVTSSKDALDRLYSKGYTIILLTNRPASKYKRIYSDTLYWLRTCQMKYHYIFWAEDKKILAVIDKCKNVNFVVDDSNKTCKEFKNAGIKAYQFGKDIKSLLEIEELR